MSIILTLKGILYENETYRDRCHLPAFSVSVRADEYSQVRRRLRQLPGTVVLPHRLLQPQIAV
jgi:hypothetical protein